MVKNMISPGDADKLNLNIFQTKSDYDKPDAVSHMAKGICVVLEEDTAKKDLEAVMEAIRLLNGVAVVKYIDLKAFHDFSNRTRAKMELRKELGKIVEF